MGPSNPEICVFVCASAFKCLRRMCVVPAAHVGVGNPSAEALCDSLKENHWVHMMCVCVLCICGPIKHIRWGCKCKCNVSIHYSLQFTFCDSGSICKRAVSLLV